MSMYSISTRQCNVLHLEQRLLTGPSSLYNYWVDGWRFLVPKYIGTKYPYIRQLFRRRVLPKTKKRVQFWSIVTVLIYSETEKRLSCSVHNWGLLVFACRQVRFCSSNFQAVQFERKLKALNLFTFLAVESVCKFCSTSIVFDSIKVWFCALIATNKYGRSHYWLRAKQKGKRIESVIYFVWLLQRACQ